MVNVEIKEQDDDQQNGEHRQETGQDLRLTFFYRMEKCLSDVHEP